MKILVFFNNILYLSKKNQKELESEVRVEYEVIRLHVWLELEKNLTVSPQAKIFYKIYLLHLLLQIKPGISG